MQDAPPRHPNESYYPGSTLASPYPFQNAAEDCPNRVHHAMAPVREQFGAETTLQALQSYSRSLEDELRAHRPSYRGHTDQENSRSPGPYSHRPVYSNPDTPLLPSIGSMLLEDTAYPDGEDSAYYASPYYEPSQHRSQPSINAQTRSPSSGSNPYVDPAVLFPSFEFDNAAANGDTEDHQHDH